jgi:hypothetical protein
MAKSSRQLDREIAQILSQKPVRARARSAPASADRFEWRSVGGEGDPWPAWLRALKSSCGVYAVRDASSGNVLYVGSSRARLYDTVTRHFQQWKRKKNWWKGLHGAGHDPGLVYQRGRCEVGVRTVACGTELDAEADLIARLKPRDNLVENPDGEDAPF